MSGLLLLRRPSYVRCLSSRLSQVRHYALIGKPRASDEPRWVLPKTPARTRFAPSPTGYLHLGSLRTALYNYLLAQATGGQFIIRLEDTDQARFVADAEEVLYDDLRWAGLHWDEGPDKGGPFGPYKQSERLDLYTQHANSLLESGHAFRCFCTKEDLEFNLQQATSSGGAAHYPGTCTHIEKGESDRRAANGEPHVVRFKSAEKPVSALDLVYGTYKKAEREDNFIIMKSDGFPTYHFANVVDDHFMKITHVVRGAEWLISTPKHVELYNALGWQPPNFAHVGLLVDAQRQKLSKRDMANIGIGVYRSSHVVPEALLNFSALLGWDPNLQKNTHLNKRGVMTLEEMKQNFTLKFTRGDIIVDLSKLHFFQRQLTRSLISGENPDRATLNKQIIQPILDEVRKVDEGFKKGATEPHLQELYNSIAPRGLIPSLREDDVLQDYILGVLKAWKGPVEDPFQFLQDNLFAFFRPSKKAMRKAFFELQKTMARVMLAKGKDSKYTNTDCTKVLSSFTAKLSRIDQTEWTVEKLGDVVKELVDTVKFYDTLENKDKTESAGWAFMRYALINGQRGSALVPLMSLFGYQETKTRIRDARKIARKGESIVLNEARMARVAARKQGELNKVHYHATHQREEATTDRDRCDFEARNAEIVSKAPSEEGPFSILLQKEKGRGEDIGEGPFKARPPTTRRPPSPPSEFREPVGEAPFSILLQKEKGRGEDIGEGPFKARPPTPRRPPSPPPPRDPSEIKRSPHFLSLSEFKFGTRHIKPSTESDTHSPAFRYALDQRQPQVAKSRHLETPEKVQVDAIIKANDEGRWAIPKSRLQQWDEAQSQLQEAQPQKVSAAPKAANPFEVLFHDRAEHIKENHDTTADTTSVVGKVAPFKLAGAGPPIDRTNHVKHLRRLNTALALKRMAKGEMPKRGGRRELLDWTVTEPGRLEELKETGLGPMSQNSVPNDSSHDLLASDAEQDSQRAYDGEQATAVAPNHDRSTVRNGVARLGDAWGTSQGLDYYGKRQAAANRTAREKLSEEDGASLAEIERRVAKQWANRRN